MIERVPTTMEERMQAWGAETAPKTELTLDEYLAARPEAPKGWVGRPQDEEPGKYADGRLLGDFSYDDLSLTELIDLVHSAAEVEDKSTQGEALAHIKQDRISQKIVSGETSLADTIEVARLAKDDAELRDVAMAGIHNRLLEMVNDEKMTFEAAINHAESIDTLIKRSDEQATANPSEQTAEPTGEDSSVESAVDEPVATPSPETIPQPMVEAAAETLATSPEAQEADEEPVELDEEETHGILDGMSLIEADRAAQAQKYQAEMADKGIIVENALLDSQVQAISSSRLHEVSKELEERSRRKRVQKMLGRFSLRRLFKRSAA